MNIKELKPLDYIIIAAVIAVLAIGVLVVLGKNKFSKSPVEATEKIAFQVMLKSVSVTDTKLPFKVGDESFITIRNVPYTKLQIIDVMFQPKKMVLPINNPAQPFVIIDDFSQPYQYDFIITLIDEAKITKDGPVVGGNKIKIGLPIVLEGYNYRIGGTISNVQTLDDKDLAAINKFVEDQKLKQNLLELQSQQQPSETAEPEKEVSKSDTTKEPVKK